MAFCNKCGTTLLPGASFCNKCGTPIASATTTPVTAAPAPPPTGGSSAVKVVLIVVGVIVVLGILALATVGIVGYRIAKGTRVRQEGDRVKIETPFGKVETSKDPEEAARQLGIDIYPGAKVQKEGATSTSIGNMHTVNAVFETTDSVEKVCAFYQSRVKNAMVATSDQSRCTFVSNDARNVVTINVEASGENTRIQVSNVMK